MINASISLEGERGGNRGGGCVRHRVCSTNNPSALPRSTISHCIESRGSTEGNRGSRIEGAIGEARVDDLRAVDRVLSWRIAKAIMRRRLRVESPLQILACGS